MVVKNDSVSRLLGRVVILLLLVAAYFGAALVPRFIDYLNIRQIAITTFGQRLMPNFNNERRINLVNKLIEEVEKETGVELDPQNVTFKVTKDEEYLEIEYTIEAKLLFVDKYLEVPASIYLE